MGVRARAQQRGKFGKRGKVKKKPLFSNALYKPCNVRIITREPFKLRPRRRRVNVNVYNMYHLHVAPVLSGDT